MKLEIPPPEVKEAGLRALVTIATADGKLHQLERELFTSVQKHILHSDIPLESLPTITPAELAAKVPQPDFRKRIVFGCILMTLMDEDADEKEVGLVDAFAKELGVEDKSLKTLHTFAEERFKLVRFDLLRRFIVADRLKKEWSERGLAGIARLAKQALLTEDTKTADKYLAFEALPDGTLGKEYWRFMKRNDFAFPGQKGAPPDLIVFHDCNHVLSGYETDPLSESQIAAFHAGYRQDDPMGMMLFSMMQFHLGVQITPVDPSHHGLLSPELLIKAFARGAQMNTDLTQDWNPDDDWNTPVAELIERFAIPPKT